MMGFRPLEAPTPFLFFTGKGGVGKTSLACATAIGLADRGRRVLLVSTDPASNLDEMLRVQLGDQPRDIPEVPGLAAMNIDPEAAAELYRARVLAQLGADASADERATVREQLSGACTTEIAAFDAFVGLLAGDMAGYDHIVFDTAPTGHTLRLLSLPKAWSGFLEGNDRGASCLGPHSGLKMQEGRFRSALLALSDPRRTMIVLVTRADRGAVRETARTAAELAALGLLNQFLVVNARFHASAPGDPVAEALERDQTAIMESLPEILARLPRDEVPMQAYDMVGVEFLRALLAPKTTRPATPIDLGPHPPPPLRGLGNLVEDLAGAGRGLVMVMGKGGVGKTTVAAALAVGLAAKGHGVHLSTTDPAANVVNVLEGSVPGLTVDRIDPTAETQRYIDKIMATRGSTLDGEGRRLLREDLASPCTEEVAVFHAFSRIVAEARSAFVVLDTAPTGHTLLLMDATGAYHRQMLQQLDPTAPGRVVTPLMRLQDPDYTRVILVTLPETTPISEAAGLQQDLRRAKIEPFGWVINRCLSLTQTRDPLLHARLDRERSQIERVTATLARRTYGIAWRTVPPIGVAELTALAKNGGRSGPP